MTSKRKNKKTQSPSGRTWMYIAICAVAIPLLGLIIFIGSSMYVSSRLAQDYKSPVNVDQVQKDVVASRETNEPTFDTQRQERLETLLKAGVVSSNMPAYSSKTDACSIQGRGNLGPQDWQQICFIQYIDLMPTSLSRAEVVERLNKVNQNDILGEPVPYELRGCDVLRKLNYYPALIYFDLKQVTKGTAYICHVPQKNDFRTSIKVDEKDIRTVRSFNPAKVDTSKVYIIVGYENTYYNEYLGCQPPHCSAPADGAITGF